MSEGRVVSRGRIMVDARRAVAKLREHLLVDLRHYALEVARAAVAAGASRIDVEYDADDVRIGWQSPLIDSQRQVRLLDLVLSEGLEGEAQAWRLLALGVNAALGLEPAFVDLYARDERETRRVRFEPKFLQEGAADPRMERVDDVDLAPGTMQIHVRRRLGWAVVRRATLGGVPEEIVALGVASEQLPIELTLQGEPWPRGDRPRTLLRVPLDLPSLDAKRCELVVTEREISAPALSFLEHGIALAHYALDTGPYAKESFAGVNMPVRAIVDAEALPTNASRSALREDSPMLANVNEAARAALPKAIAALRSIVLGQGKLEDGVVVEKAAHGAFEDALGAFVCLAAGALRREVPVAPEVSALLELPILRDACGSPQSYVKMAATDPPFFAHRGSEPLEPALSLWLSRVLWVRGRVAERAFVDVELSDASKIIELAREGLARRQVLLSHPPAKLGVPFSADHVSCEDFEVSQGPYAGLRGQVALRKTRTGPTVRVFFEEREIANYAFAAALIPLAADVAIAWDERIRVRFGFDGVEDDEVLRSALWYALQIGVRQAAALAGDRELAPLLRAAVGTALGAADALGLDERFRIELTDALRQAAIWPTSEPERFASLVEIAGEIARTGALCVTGAGVTGAAANGRIVVACAGTERRWLLAALRVSEEALVDYTRALSVGSRHAVAESVVREELERQNVIADEVPRMPFVRPGARGVAAVGRTAHFSLAHAGHALRCEDQPFMVASTLVAADDDTVVPTPDWTSVLWWGRIWGPRAIERELCTTMVAALAGDVQAREKLGGWEPSTSHPLVRLYLLQIAVALAEDDEAMEDLRASLESLPLVTMLDEAGRPELVSLRRVRAHHARQLPVLSEAPGFETLDWHPLILNNEERAIVVRTTWQLDYAEDELSDRRERALRDRIRRALLAKPAIDPSNLDGLADASLPVVRGREGALHFTLGFARESAPHASLAMSYLRRPVCSVELPELEVPLVGRVDTSVEECFEDFARVAPGWIPLVEKSTKVVAALLAKQLLGTASILDARIARLLTTVAAELRDEIRDQVRFPTLQAGEAKLDELRRADGLVYTSSRRYPSWRSGSSELDKPVLFVPQGSPLERLLPSLQVGLRDVTDAVAQLQERRGRAGEVPRLAGQAAHPALRAPIEDPVLRGEIELCEIASEVTLVDVVGYSHTLDGPFLCPVRAVIQADELFSAALATRAAARIADATFELLPKLAEQLDVLPDFVRDAVRALLRSRAVSGVEPSRPVKAARVLPDIDGRWHSLLELEAHEAVPFTTSEPPFPKRSEPVLRLALNEIAPLERVLRLADITNELEREAEAERRRQTPPRASIELPLELKARCLWTQRFEADGMRGEIGIMTPQQAKHGIDLSTGGRPLCRLDEAWPLCAAVDAPVEANRFFDGVENDDEARKVVSRLRAFAETLLRKHLAPPADALAAVWIDIVVPDEIHVIGTLWLPRAWPRRRPQVRVRASTLASEHADVALRRLFGSEHIEHLIPVDGNLLVRAEDSSDLHQPLVNLALEHAEAMLAAARQNAAADARELERFHWNLFLIGAAMPEAPVAMVADGRRIDGHDLVAELEQRGELWLTRRRGSIEGSFPSREPPAFVLLDDQPLIDVLRARLTHSILRELGGETDREDDPDAVEIVPVLEDESAESWFAGAISRVRDLLSTAPEPIEAEDALQTALLNVLRDLGLPGDPVHSIDYGSGRAIRYDRDNRRLVLDKEHEVVRAAAPNDAIAIALLAAAAVTEIQRARVSVTDAVARHAILTLLETA